MMSHLLLHQGQLGVTIEVSTLEQVLALIEEMENVVQPCNWCQKTSVWHEILAGKTWQELKVGW